MYYDGKEYLDAFMSSFERIGRNNEEKKGLVLPNMADMLTLKEEIINLFFPGLSGGEYPDELLSAIHFHYNNVVKLLADSVLLSYAYEDKGKSDSDVLEKKTKESMDKLLYALPMIRKQLKLDANAALDGDPAAKSLHEVILSYPSLRALSIHRVSHFLYVQKVPLVPRMLNELVHQETGIDIHPGAEIGKSFFIDHGTGTVIGETSVIGNHVRIFQGVSLAGEKLPPDENGNAIRGVNRHPILEDHVTVYSNATLIGKIRIGKGSTICGNVWITEDVPEGTIVQLSVDSRPYHKDYK